MTSEPRMVAWRVGGPPGRPGVLTFELDGLAGVTVLCEVDTAVVEVRTFTMALRRLGDLLHAPREGDPLSAGPSTRTRSPRRARAPR